MDVLHRPLFFLSRCLRPSGEGSDLQIYNVFDVPAGVVPVTKVTKDDVTQMEKYPECNEAYIAIKKVYDDAVL